MNRGLVPLLEPLSFHWENSLICIAALGDYFTIDYFTIDSQEKYVNM